MDDPVPGHYPGLAGRGLPNSRDVSYTREELTELGDEGELKGAQPELVAVQSRAA